MCKTVMSKIFRIIAVVFLLVVLNLVLYATYDGLNAVRIFAVILDMLCIIKGIQVIIHCVRR